MTRRGVVAGLARARSFPSPSQTCARGGAGGTARAGSMVQVRLRAGRGRMRRAWLSGSHAPHSIG